MRKSLVPYPGGKYYIANKIVSLLPAHRVYVEPFAGAANVLFAKPESEVEVVNDLDWRITTLLRVLKEPAMYEELVHRLRYTLYSRDEFVRAREVLLDGRGYSEVEKAWGMIVAGRQGFGGNWMHTGSWGRHIGHIRSVRSFARRPDILPFFHKRLSGVHISNTDGMEVIRAWDSPDTTFYIDPPYILSTRRSKKIYEYEQPDEYHEGLVELLIRIRGRAVVSHYSHPIYERLERYGYVRYEHKCISWMASAARGTSLHGVAKCRTIMAPRTECLWVKA